MAHFSNKLHFIGSYAGIATNTITMVATMTTTPSIVGGRGYLLSKIRGSVITSTRIVSASETDVEPDVIGVGVVA